MIHDSFFKKKIASFQNISYICNDSTSPLGFGGADIV